MSMKEGFDLPVRQRLTFRILLTTIIGLLLTLSAIGYTLLLSWQLEGGGAAINEAGSLRMRSYRLLSELEHNPDNQQIGLELTEFNRTLADLRNGDPKRPLFLPTSPDIRAQMAVVEKEWNTRMQVSALKVLDQRDEADRHRLLEEYIRDMPVFVASINQLVSLVEVELASKTTWLRLCQTTLIFLSLAASIALLYLLFLWIISPVNRLQAGIARMTRDDLSVRLPIETEDEFGTLASAFNQMADRVQTVHRTLEERVLEKTSRLRSQNHEISTLYEIAGFLAGPHSIEQLCRGFLRRIMLRIDADGGTVRILDPQSGNLHMTVHEGVSEYIAEEEHCIKSDECFCGSVTQQGVIVIRDFNELTQQREYRCQQEGFTSLAVFQIQAMDKAIGSFSLHFRRERGISGEERRLLETLGKNLGAAIENQRLIAKEKEYAVAQERNLLAQGLHDSIAQGLNFLNLQVQMLEDSLKRGDIGEIKDITPMLRAGVQESYEDVRELLLNFRTRLQDSNLESEMRNVLNKFQRQSGVQAALDFSGEGAPLASEQQLQVLFILQEALSNVRKHAQASAVSVFIKNERDFNMTVSDNGQGFSPDQVKEKEEAHVGLRIMRERADRLAANFDIHSEPGRGTSVHLQLMRNERKVA